MGRHTDPQTLEFLGKLREKGKSLGYAVKEEYEMLKGEYFADLVWKLAEDQPPLVAFEIETEDSIRVFRNVGKYFTTRASDMPKPFRFFLIVIRGKLSSGNRTALGLFLDYQNVSLFEDVVNNKEAENILFQQLDEMKLQIKDLVMRCLSSGQFDTTMIDLIEGIRKGMRRWPIMAKNVTLTFSSGGGRDPSRPYRIRMISKTPPGKPTIIQRIIDAVRTGQKMTISREEGVEVELPGLGRGTSESIEVVPEKVAGIRVGLETQNYDNYIELVLTRKEVTDDSALLTNEEQEDPYRVELTVHKKKPWKLAVSLVPGRGSTSQIVAFQDFMEQAKKQNRLVIRNLHDNGVLYEGAFPDIYQPLPENVMQRLRTIAEIEQETGIALPFPTQVGEEDARTINELHQIIHTGKQEDQLTSLTVDFTKEQARRRLYLAKNPEITDNFQAEQKSYSITLFGKTIPLGSRSVVVPEARIDLSKLESELSKGSEPIHLEVSSASDKPINIFYKNWPRQK